MPPRPAMRMRGVHRYVFGEIDEAIDRERDSGREICDLSKSDPNWPPSQAVIEALRREAGEEEAHRYPPYDGAKRLRQAFSDWYERNYSARCTPEHVLILEGSKLGIATLPFAYLDSGEVGLIPDPGYPSYREGIVLAGGRPVSLALRPELGYLPDYRAVDSDALGATRLLFLNYPHNPTGATATIPFLEETLALARREDFLVAYDLAYAKIVLRGQNPALSLRSQRNGDAYALEFFTFSKSYDMQGYRLAAAVANPELLAPLRRVHENLSAGVYLPIQVAGRAALDPHEDRALYERVESYARRQNLVVEAIRGLEGHCTSPEATVYVWMHAPRDLTGDRFAQELLRVCGIAVTPGNAFGRQGERYVRISLTAPDAQVQEAVRRLRETYPQGFENAPEHAANLH